LTYAHKNIFVEHIANQRSHPNVVISAMLEEQDGKKSKLSYSIIGGISGLETLLPTNTNANMSLL
jgi:hypothetical protein